MKLPYLSLLLLSLVASACSYRRCGQYGAFIYRPETVDDAAVIVICMMSDEGKATIRSMTCEELTAMNDTWGMWIRNELGINGRNMPLMVHCGGLPPRECSMMIIERIQERLWEEHIEEQS